jgi:hypothetical protein
MALPPQADNDGSVSVRAITALPSGLVAVSLRFADGSTRTLVMASDLATYDGVTWSAQALANLVATGKVPT